MEKNLVMGSQSTLYKDLDDRQGKGMHQVSGISIQ